MARAPRRGRAASPSRRSTSGCRRSTWPGRSSRRRWRRTSARHPRAGPLRADLHVPARLRVRHELPRRGDRGRLGRPGLHPGRPLPVQREEVRRRPGGDDRGDPQGLPRRDRRRLPQHRHRQLDPGRPLDSRRVDEQQRVNYTRRRRAHGAHPRARARRRDDLRRRRDRRSRQGELEPGRAAGLPRRLPPRARRPRPGAIGVSKVSVATGTSHGGIPLPDGGVAEVKLDFEVLRVLGEVARTYGARRRRPARREHAAGRAVPPFPTVETAEIHLATGFQNASTSTRPSRRSCTRDRGLVLRRTRPTSARTARPTPSSSTRPARRRSARSSVSLWELDTKDEILASQAAKVGFLFDQLKVTGTRGPPRSLRRRTARSGTDPAPAALAAAARSGIVSDGARRVRPGLERRAAPVERERPHGLALARPRAVQRGRSARHALVSPRGPDRAQAGPHVRHRGGPGDRAA